MTNPTQLSPEAEERQPSGASSLLYFLVLAVVAVLLGALVYFQPFRHKSGLRNFGQLEALKLAPVSPQGQPLELADLKGKVVLINFWGTWCPPCRKELPEIAALHKRYRKIPSAVVLAVSCGVEPQSEELEKLRRATQAYLDQNSIETPVLADMPAYLDPGEATRNAAKRFLPGGKLDHPTTILVDAEGNVRAMWLGYAEGGKQAEEMESAIDSLLAEAG